MFELRARRSEPLAHGTGVHPARTGALDPGGRAVGQYVGHGVASFAQRSGEDDDLGESLFRERKPVSDLGVDLGLDLETEWYV